MSIFEEYMEPLSQTKFWIMLVQFCFKFFPFQLLLTQTTVISTENSGPLRVHCIILIFSQKIGVDSSSKLYEMSKPIL